MGYTESEQKVLDILGKADFRHVSKDDVVGYVSMLQHLKPEIASKIIEQYPQLVKMIADILDDNRKSIDNNDKSLMGCYGLLERVQADLSKCLDKDISEGEREKILDREMDMKIFEVKERTVLLIEQLLAVWEDSVRATHLFLSENEISNIKKYVPQALKEVGRLVVAENASGFPVAFMGVEGQRLEMLFILPVERGKGLGKMLLQCGVKDYSVNELAVNEQNPLAKGFYEHMGFQVYKRAELDEQGNPYPLLYMKLD